MWFQLNWVVFTSSHMNSWAFCWRSVFFQDSYIPLYHWTHLQLPTKCTSLAHPFASTCHSVTQACTSTHSQMSSLESKRFIYVKVSVSLYLENCHCNSDVQFPNGRRMIGSGTTSGPSGRRSSTEALNWGKQVVAACVCTSWVMRVLRLPAANLINATILHRRPSIKREQMSL